jgi:pilus assembly protein CpaB
MKFPRIAINRSLVLLLAALALGGLSAFGVKRFIQHQMEEVEARGKGRMVRVLVPKEDLPKGAPLTQAAVAAREVPADWAHSNAITPQQFDRVENQKLAYPAVRGEMILWSMLEGQRAPSFSARLPAGRRAITVPVDEVNSISGMLQPGDRIDLIVSARKDSRAYMFPLLQNVVVLATGSQAVPAGDTSGKEGGRRSYTTITLDASPQDAQRVLAAREIGKLAALLRSPGDAANAFSSRRDAMSLLGLNDPERILGKEASVPVIYGGGRDAMKELPRLNAPASAASPPSPPSPGLPAAPATRAAAELAVPPGAAMQSAAVQPQ